MDLETLVDHIKTQQKLMGYENFINTSEVCRLEYIRNITLALNKELCEFLDEIPWKPWQPLEDQNFNKDAAAEELIDVMVFTVVLWVSLDPSISIETCVNKVIKKIYDRIDSKRYGHETE